MAETVPDKKTGSILFLMSLLELKLLPMRGDDAQSTDAGRSDNARHAVSMGNLLLGG